MVEFEFAGHERHSELSCAEYEPAAQFTQLSADILEYVPPRQAVHFAAPSLGLNLPGRQRLHAPFAPDEPALQEQLEIAPLPTTEYDLAGHLVHSVLSSAEYLPAAQYTQLSAAVFEYAPAAHAVHAAAPSSGLNLPGTQWLHSPFTPDQPTVQAQLEIAPLPMTEYELVGHWMHSVLSSAENLPAAQYTQLSADVFEYVPAAQAVHAAAPSSGLNLPGTQRLHSPFTPDQLALQEQLDIAPLPSSEYEFSGHIAHTDLLCAEYLPAIQNLHGYAPAFTEAEYFPG